MKFGMVTDVVLPDDISEYLLRDYDVPESVQDFRYIPESEHPDLVIDVKGGCVIDVWNNTGHDYYIFDDDI